jgi:hypothetical protein
MILQFNQFNQFNEENGRNAARFGFRLIPLTEHRLQRCMTSFEALTGET